MKPVSDSLKQHLSQPLTTIATCCYIKRLDGMVLGFTDCDQSIHFEGVVYSPKAGFSPSAVYSGDNFTVDELEIESVLDHDAVSREDLIAGLYDHAEILIFLVNYTDVSMGKLVLRSGWIGEVVCKGGLFIAEIRGMKQRLSSTVGKLYSSSCRANFGDHQCNVDLEPFTFFGQVTSSQSRSVFYDNTRLEEGAFFDNGIVTFISGLNINISMEVKQYGGEGEINLFFPMPYDIQNGDQYKIIAGCNKSFKACSSRFNNAINFQGEPFMQQ